ncbi:unnamed protein product, partial [Leptidea sinapis]
DKSR